MSRGDLQGDNRARPPRSELELVNAALIVDRNDPLGLLRSSRLREPGQPGA